MARRHADHQPPDPALAHRGELAGHDLDMPAHREADASVELEKSTRRKARKIAPDQRGALFAGAISTQRGRPTRVTAGLRTSESDPQ